MIAHRVTAIARTEGVTCDRRVDAADGGIALCFFNGKRYADIECLNDGNVYSSLSDGQGYRNVTKVQRTNIGFLKAIQRVVEHMNQ